MAESWNKIVTMTRLIEMPSLHWSDDNKVVSTVKTEI